MPIMTDRLAPPASDPRQATIGRRAIDYTYTNEHNYCNDSSSNKGDVQRRLFTVRSTHAQRSDASNNALSREEGQSSERRDNSNNARHRAYGMPGAEAPLSSESRLSNMRTRVGTDADASCAGDEIAHLTDDAQPRSVRQNTVRKGADHNNGVVNKAKARTRTHQSCSFKEINNDDDETRASDSVMQGQSVQSSDHDNATGSIAVRHRGHTCRSTTSTHPDSDATHVSLDTTTASTDSSYRDKTQRMRGSQRILNDTDGARNNSKSMNYPKKNTCSSQLSPDASLKALIEGNKSTPHEAVNACITAAPDRGRLYGFKICKGRFEALSRIGSGSFGVIYSGIDTHTGIEIAIKFEPVRVQHQQAMFENRIYKLLHSEKFKNFHPTITRYIPSHDSPDAEKGLSAGSASVRDRVCNDNTRASSPIITNNHTSYSETNGIGLHGTALNQPHANGSANSNAYSNRHGNGDDRRGVGNLTSKGVPQKSRSTIKSREKEQSHGVMMEFMSLQNVVGFPRSHFYGTEGEYNVLVMDFLGPNLEDLFRFCSRRFSLKTVCLLADQMLHRLEYLHHIGFIHRDLKPENFVMGNDKSNAHVLYLIDFGLAKRFWDVRLNQHVPYKEGVPLTGTARYCSINAHLGTQQSRRDDLESLGYIILYFMKNGTLPWQGLRGFTDAHAKNVRISEKKINTSLEMLCRDEPQQMYRYMKYVRDLKFDEVPDYRLCREFFAQILERHGYKRDWVFDWVVHRQKEKLTEGSIQQRSFRPE